MLVSGGDEGTICFWESEIRFGQNRYITTFDLKDNDNKSETTVTSIVFSPDGSTLASGYNDGTIRLWEISTRKNKNLKGHADSILSLDFSFDGRTLASGSRDKTICIWDTKAAQHLTTLKEHTDTVFSVVFRSKESEENEESEESEELVSESSDGIIRFWNTETGKNEKTLIGGYIGNIESIVFSPNGQVLASIGNRGWNDTIIYFWDVNTGKIRTSITKKGEIHKLVHFSPDSRTFISRSKETIHCWDVNTGEVKSTIVEKIETVESIRFSPDSKTLLTIQKEPNPHGYSSRDSGENIHLWDIDTGEQKASITEKIANLESAHFSPDSKTLLTIGTKKKVDDYGRSTKSSGKSIDCWDVSTGEMKTTITEKIANLESAHFSPDSKTLVGVTASNIYFWEIETGKSRKTTLVKGTSNIESIAFSRDSRLFLSVNTTKVNEDVHSDTKESKTSTFCFWDVETGEPISTHLKEMTDNIESVTFNSDKTKFATVHSNNLIRLWDVNTGRHQSTFEGAQEDITSVAFSLDNRTLACASRNGMILVWEITK